MTPHATLQARLDYIIQNGNAWEKAVAQGVHDHAALGLRPASEDSPSPPHVRLGQTGAGSPMPGGISPDLKMPSARTLLRLARQVGAGIADAMHEREDDLQSQENAAMAAADPLTRTATDLLAATLPLAQALAKQPHDPASPHARWLKAARAHLEATRAAQES